MSITLTFIAYLQQKIKLKLLRRKRSNYGEMISNPGTHNYTLNSRTNILLLKSTHKHQKPIYLGLKTLPLHLVRRNLRS